MSQANRHRGGRYPDRPPPEPPRPPQSAGHSPGCHRLLPGRPAPMCRQAPRRPVSLRVKLRDYCGVEPGSSYQAQASIKARRSPDTGRCKGVPRSRLQSQCRGADGQPGRQHRQRRPPKRHSYPLYLFRRLVLIRCPAGQAGARLRMHRKALQYCSGHLHPQVSPRAPARPHIGNISLKYSVALYHNAVSAFSSAMLRCPDAAAAAIARRRRIWLSVYPAVPSEPMSFHNDMF